MWIYNHREASRGVEILLKYFCDKDFANDIKPIIAPKI